jgi:hypothetical protein
MYFVLFCLKRFWFNLRGQLGADSLHEGRLGADEDCPIWKLDDPERQK